MRKLAGVQTEVKVVITETVRYIYDWDLDARSRHFRELTLSGWTLEKLETTQDGYEAYYTRTDSKTKVHRGYIDTEIVEQEDIIIEFEKHPNVIIKK